MGCDVGRDFLTVIFFPNSNNKSLSYISTNISFSRATYGDVAEEEEEVCVEDGGVCVCVCVVW